MRDFLLFRRMITPGLMVVLWVVTTAAVVIWSIRTITQSDGYLDDFERAVGWVGLVFGPVLVRVFFEILIVVFSINETLTDIKNLTETNRHGSREPRIPYPPGTDAGTDLAP